MPLIRNISNSNIVINNKILDPGKSMTVTQEQLEDLQGLINDNKLKVEVSTVKRSEIKVTILDKDKSKEFEKLKERLIPAFFALHLNQGLTLQQLEDLKWFFKNVGPTSTLDFTIKSLLDDVESDEELLEVLLNHLYPELIKNHFNKL